MSVVARPEAAAFAEAVATAADRTLGPAPDWVPGALVDDRSPALSAALAEMGWLDLAGDPELAPLAGPAALGLGRRLAPLCDVDALLGGSPLAGELVRYGAAVAVVPGGARVAVERSEPIAYGDALGVHRVLARRPDGRVAPTALTAWTAASTGYLAGLSDGRSTPRSSTSAGGGRSGRRWRRSGRSSNGSPTPRRRSTASPWRSTSRPRRRR